MVVIDLNQAIKRQTQTSKSAPTRKTAKAAAPAASARGRRATQAQAAGKSSQTARMYKDGRYVAIPRVRPHAG